MQRHVAEILSGLRGRVSHTLAASKEFYNTLPKSAVDGIDFVPIDIGDSIGPKTLSQAFGLVKHIKRSQATIVHSHGYKAAVPGVIAARLAGVKSVITGHNLFPANASLLAKLSIRLAARLSNRVIAVAPALAESLIAAGVKYNKITVILNGIGVSAYGNHGRQAIRDLGISDDTPVVLCAARLTEVKGVEYLIRASAFISKRRPDVRVLIAGDGPDKDKLVDRAKRLAPNTVRFIGQRNDIPALLSGADVVAIPSLAEGHPLILVEAMASGKPIVASSVGGIVDELEDSNAGILVQPTKTGELVEAILSVIESPKMAAEFGKCARIYAEREYTVEKMLARTEEVYSCVVS